MPDNVRRTSRKISPGDLVRCGYAQKYVVLAAEPKAAIGCGSFDSREIAIVLATCGRFAFVLSSGEEQGWTASRLLLALENAPDRSHGGEPRA